MTKMTVEEMIEQLQSSGYDVNPHSDIRDYDRYLDQGEFCYILWLDRIYQKILSTPGQIVEVGVARGRNAILFGHMIRMNGDDQTRNYYGIDTFDGYTESDLRRSPHLSPETWKSTTLEFVQERLLKARLSRTCHVFQGDVKKVAPELVNSRQSRFFPGKLRIAILYIDCNAYEPAKFAMDFFKPYMSQGSVICIDEKVQGGETEALIEFCRENGLKFQKDTGPFAIPAHTIVP